MKTFFGILLIGLFLAPTLRAQVTDTQIQKQASEVVERYIQLNNLLGNTKIEETGLRRKSQEQQVLQADFMALFHDPDCHDCCYNDFEPPPQTYYGYLVAPRRYAVTLGYSYWHGISVALTSPIQFSPIKKQKGNYYLSAYIQKEVKGWYKSDYEHHLPYPLEVVFRYKIRKGAVENLKIERIVFVGEDEYHLWEEEEEYLTGEQLYALAEEELEEGNLRSVISILEEAISINYVPAYNFLGSLYEEGLGVKRDFFMAVRLFHHGASQGDPKAQNNLGLMYYDGRGIIQDKEQAFYWIEQAALQDYSIAQLNLAMLYEAGEGVEKNQEKAIYWYKKAARQYNIKARDRLQKLKIDWNED
jgi:hypothetical protein